MSGQVTKHGLIRPQEGRGAAPGCDEGGRRLKVAEVDPLDWRPPRMPTRVAVDPRWGQSLLNMEVENDSMEPEMNYAASRRTGVKRVTITFDVPLNTSFSLAVRSEVIDAIKRVLEGHGVEGENYRVVTEAKPW